MTKFTVEITDKAQLAGITAAREAYNASLPEGDDAPAPLANDAEYVQFVMGMAAQSYANQYG